MNETVHVAITRKVKPGREEEFENAIRGFFMESLKDTGSLGAQIIKPLPGSKSRTYGILRSFAGEKDRDDFYRSELFRTWQETVKPLVEEDYSRRDLHGLEAFFYDPGIIGHPPRWKMAIVTWMGVWPTVYVVAHLLGKHLAGWPSFVATGLVTLVVVSVLTWGVMPVLTRLVRPWLVRTPDIRPKERNET